MGADGRHLRPGAFGHNGSHDIAAKGRTGLQQEPGIIDGQPGAIGGETGSELGGDSAGQISAQAKQAMTGYDMQTKDMGNGTTAVTLTPSGQPGQAKTYQVKTAQSLYFVEKRSGDDQAGSDNNLEDDNAIVVDSQGFVVSQ